MGLMLLLKFALLCIDYLAWPVIALGYPLFASIRAVETDSKYHMKKLIIYWTLFSLISLFEFAFLKLIVWIPFWDRIRLIAIIRLVMPGFQGACHAYQILVRPVLSTDIQAVIDKLYWYKTKGDMKPTFLEQYIKENGLEALERLIATKQECNKLERDILVLEAEGKNDVPTTSQQQLQYAETTPPETPPIEKCKQEWTCDICKVTTTSETMLNAHLQGSKHRSNCESLKGSIFHAQDTSSSKKSIRGSLQKPKQDDSPPETPPIKKYKKEWNCDLCKVTTTSETTLNAHLQGSKHRSKCETNQIFNLYCNVCSLKLDNNNLDSHIKGKRHMSNIEKTSSMKKVVEMNE